MQQTPDESQRWLSWHSMSDVQHFTSAVYPCVGDTQLSPTSTTVQQVLRVPRSTSLCSTSATTSHQLLMALHEYDEMRMKRGAATNVTNRFIFPFFLYFCFGWSSTFVYKKTPDLTTSPRLPTNTSTQPLTNTVGALLETR